MAICIEYTNKYNKINKTNDVFEHSYLPILGIENRQLIFRCSLCGEMHQKIVDKEKYFKGPHARNIRKTEGRAKNILKEEHF